MAAHPDNQSVQSFEEKLASFEKEIADKKIKFPPDIFEYVKDHFLALQRISREGRMPTEKEMEFMEHVRMWLSLDEVDREKFTNIDAMLNNSDFQEATKRDISVSQYVACVGIANHLGYSDASRFSQLFQFPGGGRIVSGKIDGITIANYTRPLPESWEVNEHLSIIASLLDKLPKNLKVGGYFSLNDCPTLKIIPDNFSVGGELSLTKCPSLSKIGTGLVVKKDGHIHDCEALETIGERSRWGGNVGIFNCTSLKKFPSDFKVAGSLSVEKCPGFSEIPDNVNGPYFAPSIFLFDCSSLVKLPSSLITSTLDLRECTSLKNLPAHLEVDTLNIHGCDSLEDLPDDVIIKQNLLLSNNPPKKVADWVEKLLNEGKIKGKIKYL